MNPAPRPIPTAFAGLLALAVAMGIGRFIYTPILPSMIEALGLRVGQAGLIASANFAGYLFGALLTSTRLLSGSRRTWLLAALAVSVASTAAMAFFDQVFAFVLVRFIGGFASALVLVFASALVLENLARLARPGLMAVHFSGVGVGIAVSAVLVAGLSALAVDWRGLWLCSGAMSLLGLWWVNRWLTGRDAEPDATAGVVVGAARRPGLTRLVLAYGLFGFGYVITATFIVDLVRGSGHGGLLEPLVWLLVGLAAIPSVALWNRCASRIGSRRAFALACLLEAIGVAASVAGDGVAVLTLSAVLLGATFMGITALGLVGARQIASTDPRRVLGVMTAAFGLGQMVGPLFAGYLHDLTGAYTTPSLVAAAALVVSAGLAIWKLPGDPASLR